MQEEHSKATVLFDGGCPLCRREISHYRALDTEGRVEWVDIAATDFNPAVYGVDRASAMQRLHAFDHSGGLHLGVSAFVLIWRNLPGYRWVARAVVALHLTAPLNWAYGHFARWRWNRRCTDGVCVIGDPSTINRQEN